MRIGILLGVVLVFSFHLQGVFSGRNPCNSDTTNQTTAAQFNSNQTKMSNQNNTQEPDEIWGGTHIQIDVSGDVAKVEMDCAHGEISRVPKAGAQGDFDSPGTLVVEGHGPARSDRVPAARTVNYRGKIDGETMTLTITFSDTNESAGSFTLKRGKRGRIRKCM